MKHETLQPSKDDLNVRFSYGKVCLWVFGILLIATGAALRLPVMDTRVRILLAATLAFGLCTGLIHLVKLFSAYPRILYPAIFIFGMLVLWGVLANKSIDATRLRHGYMKQLRSFNAVRYTWGGESYNGVDCSGLARTALWQAMFKEGIKTMNPHLLGPDLWKTWWRDMSAGDILSGKYGYTTVIGTADKLAGYDHNMLELGDMAIAGGVSHCLIYLGDDKWIEANPDDGKVVINKATSDSKRPYFNMKVILVRWQLLRS